MCGISGYLSICDIHEPKQILSAMGAAISSRGPDSAGQWFDDEDHVGLSHQRLAIIDMSPAGHQPMHSPSERYVISFNGEIYNHNEMREELHKLSSDITWQGHSDTETLLACFDAWGILETVKRSVGMFAFAVWDKKLKILTLGRDRFGEKPLYYGWQNGTFLFGSELKALKSHPAFAGTINRNVIPMFLRYSYIPAPFSIYEGIKKLMPGSLASISIGCPDPAITIYWSLQDVAKSAINNRFDGSANEAVAEFEQKLRRAIKLQMISDVPLGAFLSGGVDSSAIVALMQSESQAPIKTFSIGFGDAQYNEAHHAKAIANHLGTEHKELYVSAEDSLKVIPLLAEVYDEPFADASQIPTYLVAKMAKQYVTVSLSGDAGDELFCGYNRYLMANKLWNRLSYTPLFLRKFISSFITSLSPSVWDKLAKILLKFMPKKYGMASVPWGDKLYKGANVMCASDIRDLHHRLISVISNPEYYVLNAVEPQLESGLIGDGMGSIEQMMLMDSLNYLPNDVLAKVDRAAMAVSLETRVPFLDHRLGEFSFSLPLEFKLRDGVGKWCLRQVLYKYVPKSLIDRPKMGFAVPIDSWLRGPLKDWAENLISEERLIADGFFNSSQVRALWEEHLSGRRNSQYQLWNILMFQLWLTHNPVVSTK